MKHLTLLVLVMLLGAQAFGQKKKSKDELAEMKLDSLTLVNQKLTVRADSMAKLFSAQTVLLDSISKDLARHELMYTAVKEKVMKRDFDPARTAVVIDSLKANRDASMSGLTKGTRALSDTLALVKQENARLKASLSSWENRAATNEQVVTDLLQLKGLLDQKIITQSEFDQRKNKLLAKWK